MIFSYFPFTVDATEIPGHTSDCAHKYVLTCHRVSHRINAIKRVRKENEERKIKDEIEVKMKEAMKLKSDLETNYVVIVSCIACTFITTLSLCALFGYCIHLNRTIQTVS